MIQFLKMFPSLMFLLLFNKINSAKLRHHKLLQILFLQKQGQEKMFQLIKYKIINKMKDHLHNRLLHQLKVEPQDQGMVHVKMVAERTDNKDH